MTNSYRPVSRNSQVHSQSVNLTWPWDCIREYICWHYLPRKYYKDALFVEIWILLQSQTLRLGRNRSACPQKSRSIETGLSPEKKIIKNTKTRLFLPRMTQSYTFPASVELFPLQPHNLHQFRIVCSSEGEFLRSLSPFRAEELDGLLNLPNTKSTVKRRNITKQRYSNNTPQNELKQCVSWKVLQILSASMRMC